MHFVFHHFIKKNKTKLLIITDYEFVQKYMPFYTVIKYS